MRQIEIEAYADVGQPDQGRVALLLRGVPALARTPILQLRPVDPAALADGDGQWPDADIMPTEARVVDDGVELIIGPDITESPALLPGTAVEIEVPELRLWGEVLWPSVSLATRPRRRSVVGKRVPAAARTVTPAVRDGVPAGNTAKPAPATTDYVRPDLIQPDVVRPEPARSRVARADVAATAQPSRPPPPVQRAPQPSPARPDPRPEKMARRMPERDRDEPDVPPPDAARPAAGRMTWQRDDAYADPVRPADRRIPEPDALPTATRPVPPAAPTRGNTWTSRARAFGLIIGTVLAIEAVLFAAKGYLPMSAGADPTPGRMTRTSAVAAGDLRLKDLLQAGPASPRGVTVKESQPAKLLALANASLHAPGAARDVEEGAYWLKRYIAASLGEGQMLRALTQLGSAYAEPAIGTPDFVRARQLWEFASAFGDPVAMCFIGALYEHGLGVASEKKVALAWYARAKAAGSCPQLEASIARVMP